MSLRIYQEQSLAAIKADMAAGYYRLLLVTATGCGKTVVCAHVPDLVEQRQKRKRGIFIVHRDELVLQAADKFAQYNPHLRVGIEKAKQRADDADIVIASLQTIGRSKVTDVGGHEVIEYSKRLMAYDPDQFIWQIVDEGHHATSPQYTGVLKYMRCLKGDPDCDPKKLLLLVTATPNRSDNIGLEKIVDKITFNYGIRPAIKDKWLVRPICHRVETEVDISKVHTVAGDFNPAELVDVINTPVRNELVAQEYLRNRPQGGAFFFTVNVKHAHDLGDVLRGNGIRVYPISGDTPDTECRRFMRLINEGAIDGLASAGKLCLDEKTEILTNQGWTGIDAMTMDHLVANWDSGSVFFKQPRAIVRRLLEEGERMVSVKCREFDIRVTDNHRMLYRTWRTATAKYKLKRARYLIGRSFQIPCCGTLDAPVPWDPLIEQEVAPTKRGRLISALAYSLRKRHGYTEEESKKEAGRRVDRKRSLAYTQPNDITLDECRLIGFWLGDGSANHPASGGVEYTLCQSSRYMRIVEWLRGVLQSAGIHFIEREHPAPKGKKEGSDTRPYYTWSLPRGTGGGRQERSGVYHLEPYLKKIGSRLFWGFTERQFIALLEGLWMADGEHGESASWNPDSMRIAGSAERKCLDLIQAIAACRGYRSTLNPMKTYSDRHGLCNRLSLSRKQEIGMSENTLDFEDTWKPERVWCVTTESGCIITRRGGKVIVTGNSEGVDVPRAQAAYMVRPTKSQLLFTQMVGRVLRLYPSPEDLEEMSNSGQTPEWIKPHAMVTDFVDISGRHSLVTVPTLFGLRAKYDPRGKDVLEQVEEIEAAEAENPGLDLHDVTDLDDVRNKLALLKTQQRQVDLLSVKGVPPELRGMTKLAWICESEGSYTLSLMDAGMISVRIDTLGAFEIFRHTKGVRAKLAAAHTLKEAIAMAEKEIPSGTQKIMKADASWRNEPPSEKQIGRLFQIDAHHNRTFRTLAKLWEYALQRYHGGDPTWSKGGVSKRMDAIDAARR